MSDDRFTAERLREELARVAEVAGDGQQCPPAERIVLSARGELPPGETQALILHIADCTSCGAAWRVARDIAGEIESATFPVGRTRPLVRWTGLAAAAILVLAVSTGVFLLNRERRAPPPYRTPESLSIVSKIEEGTALARERFGLEWTGGPPGTLYDLRIMTAALQPLLKREGLDRSEFVVPQEVLKDLASGERVLWHVTARLPDGRRIESDTFFAMIE